MKSKDWSRSWSFFKVGQDAQIRVLDLPHDAMLEEERIPGLAGGSSSGYFPGGHYVYEKTLFAGEELRGKTVQLAFDGVYGKTKVYCNGSLIVENHYGYSDFVAEVSGKLKIGEENVIRVDVDNTQTPNSRWYTGSGIYRHVRLLTGGGAYIPYRGVRVSTSSLEPPTFHVEVAAEGDVLVEVLDGEIVLSSATGSCVDIPLPGARLWSPEDPRLYDIRVTLSRNSEIEDQAIVRGGLRLLDWSAAHGLRINGIPTKLKGGCVHHDHGILGARSYKAAELRRVRKLKEAGYNAIRTAHNPASEELLEACDELGMLVMHESFDMWREPKSTYDYALYFEKEWEKDLHKLIERSYNHPSVILYSIGNEVSMGTETAHELNRRMTDFCHRLDPSRPVTNAITCMAALSKPTPKEKEKPIRKASPDDVVDPQKPSRQRMAGSFLINVTMTALPVLIDKAVTAKKTAASLGDVMDTLDVTGMNYSNHIMEELQTLKPKALFLNTETFPARIGKNWPLIEKQPRVLGDFMWTAWDYLGETGIGVPGHGRDKYRYSRAYPCVNAGCGSFDLIGNRDAQGWLAATVFGASDRPYIGVQPMQYAEQKPHFGLWRSTDAVDSWTWAGYEGKTAHVTVFSIGVEIELLLNGRSLGKKTLRDFRADFELPYQPGELKAVSYDAAGNALAEHALHTAGNGRRLKLRAEESDGEIAFVSITLTDDEGIPVISEERRLKVRVHGDGRLLALGSAASDMTESWLDDEHSTHHGRALAVISRGAGRPIRVTVACEGMETQRMDLSS